MVRLLLRTAVFLGSSALGLLVAWLVLRPRFALHPQGLIVAVVVFALAQSVLAPFIATMAKRYAPAFLGGIGLLSTFVALLLATLIGGGLTISGVSTWLLASLVVWLVTALATFLLPAFVLKQKLGGRSDA
ncbi:phage holin family protein [Cellulomonas citrea]|uniref:phage holin family protein n=1 Tax=Cellulomonas citrea TaxID=1909423 RepID=UPI00135A7B11|nr:phage holin family protein [Cellulomonas citrea]